MIRVFKAVRGRGCIVLPCVLTLLYLLLYHVHHVLHARTFALPPPSTFQASLQILYLNTVVRAVSRHDWRRQAVTIRRSCQQTATLSLRDSACALSACMMILVSFFLCFLAFFSFHFLSLFPFLSLSCLFCPCCIINRPSLVLFFGCTCVPRLCSWCYLVASDAGWYTTARFIRAV